jgi:sugar phosphate isomerase/epimerase
MSKSAIAAQLFTLREFTRTPADIRGTMKKVRAIGYEAVQLSALGPIDPKELKEIVDGEGLAVCATHIGFERMRDDTQKVIEEHNLWGCKHVAIGGLPAEYRNEEGYHRFAKEASEVAKKLAKGGLTFSYHNHSFELQRFGDRTALEILYEESDPDYFNSEIDTYWIQHGGGDPAAWIRKLRGRAHIVHFKDMTVKGNDPIMAEVGEGNLNWPAILDACKYAGVEWYIVEQDVCQRDPFESLAISLRNLKSMGLE